MTYRIGGQVVDQGSGVADQPVFVVDTGDADPTNWTVETATTTDADGSWSVVVPSGNVERYHAVTQVDDSGTLKNSESQPYLTAHPELRPAEIPIQFNVPAPQTIGRSIPDSGLLYYTMDSADTTSTSITDVWNGNNATNNGATTGVSGANQTYNTAEAVEFASSDFINSLGIDISNQSASIALWINPQNDGEWFRTEDLQTQFMLANGTELRFRVNGNDFRGSNISQDTWHHVIGVIDSGTERRLYLDGSIDATGTDVTIADTTYQIGGGSNGYDGKVDDFRIYNKAISDTEASNLYNTGSIDG
jgi:hypothetical protein